MRLVAGLFLLFALSATVASADWHCRCGTIVHVDYPTSCPVCGRSLPEPRPPFTPPGGNVNDGTGLRLGATVYEVDGRVIVSRVDRGTPADGRLFPNDQLVKAAFRDQQNGQVYRRWISSADDIRQLKSLAGAGTKVAMEVFRPTSGSRSFFVIFAPERPQTRTYTVIVNGQPEERTSTMTSGVGESAAAIMEDSTGEAAGMLNGGGGDGPRPSRSTDQSSAGGDSAEDLLER
jgi:hypothetical protein